MAVRNPDAINKVGKQYRAELENKAQTRMARINRALEILRKESGNIIDAMDTLQAMRRNGMRDKADALSPLCKSHKINVTWCGSERYVAIKDSEKTDIPGRYNDHSMYFQPETGELHASTYLSWGGHCGWSIDKRSGDYHDDRMLPLLDEFAEKIGPWCQAVFDAVDGL